MCQNTQTIVTAFLISLPRGKAGTSIWTDGQAIYSYGTCLLARVSADQFVFNATKHSSTTTWQQNDILRLIDRDCIIARVDDVSRGTSAEALIQSAMI